MRIGVVIRVFAVLVLAMACMSCGAGQIVLKPNYKHKDIQAATIRAQPIEVRRVVDKRADSKFDVGTARVGLFNGTVPYVVNVPVSEFVQQELKTLFVANASKDTLQTTVYIDSMSVHEGSSLFSEYAECQLSMRFALPLRTDSTLYIQTHFRDRVTSGIDVTNQIEPLLYKAVATCASQFVSTITPMSLGSNSNLEKERLSSADTTAADQRQMRVGTGASVQNRRDTLIQAAPVRDLSKSKSEIGFAYSWGNTLLTSLRLSYSAISSSDSSHWVFGGGAYLEYSDIYHVEKNLKGGGITYGGAVLTRYLFSTAPRSLFVGLNLALVLSKESIDYGNRKDTHFIYGAVFRETLGMSLNRKFYVEAGLMQLSINNSEILPYDTGFTLGFGFSLN